MVEFRIIAFDEGGVSAWPIADGRAIGRNIDFSTKETTHVEDAIRDAATVLTLWHTDMPPELMFDS